MAFKDEKLWVQTTPESNPSAIIPIPSLAPLVTKIKPAVLVVTTESIDPRNQQLPPGYEDLYRFFGPNAGNPNFRQPEQNRKGLGSGFIIHPSGLALTNNHVIEGASKIKIKVGGDLKEYEAEIVGTDPDTDVALIQIKSDKKDWPTLPLGNSSAMQVGDFAMAIGNPLGLEHSISFGPISARGRRDIQPSGKRGLFDFMQLSAPINPGNSGGALVNMSGEVIGINTAISASGQGIAFAIPIDQVKQILPQLKKNGKVSRSGLGVRVENVSPELAKELGLPYTHGALVREVISGSAADKAGIQPGDVITEFDGEILNDASALSVEAGLGGIGKSVVLKVSRDNRSLTLRITLEAIDKENPIKKAELKELENLGVKVVDHQELNIQGARIAEVSPHSVANMAGLEKNDLVLKANNQLIKNADSLASLVKKTTSGGLLRLLLKRQNTSFFVVIQKP
jgi:Do/DeqQ family serine protease